MSVSDYFDRNDDLGFSAGGLAQFARRQFKISLGLAAVLFIATAALLTISAHPVQNAASTIPKVVKAQVVHPQNAHQARADALAGANTGLSLN